MKKNLLPLDQLICYRPLEEVLKEQLESFIEGNAIFTDIQSDYQRDRCCENLVLERYK